MQHLQNGLLTALIASLAVVVSATALITARTAVRRVERYKLSAPQVRELVRELDEWLDKMTAAQARDAMRRLRAERRDKQPDPEPDPVTPPAPPAPGDYKAELWSIVRGRGIGRPGPTMQHEEISA